MSKKFIIGYKPKIKNDDHMCPNCGKPCLGLSYQRGFFKVKTVTEYSCNKCGCCWKII